MSKNLTNAAYTGNGSQEPRPGWGKAPVKQDSRDFEDMAAARARPGPWWMLGFEKRTSLILFIFFGGAMLAFCLARAPVMNFKQLLRRASPGEGYWFERSPWKGAIITHIVTSIPASFFAVFCFLPITYQRWPRFHGIVGYVVSLLLLASCAAGSLCGRRGQGGDLNIQSAFYMIGSAAAYAVIMGCIEARNGNLGAHREWMFRAWFYNGMTITTRITALLSAQVITAIGSYYSVWRCAEIGYVLESSDALAKAFPQCATADALAHPNSVHVAVHASWREGDLGHGSAMRASYGMALWIAIILHCVGIELYLRMTSYESRRLQQWAEQKKNGLDQTELLPAVPR